MRVAKYYSNEEIRLEEMPIPRIGAGELLVKVMASGICGSDVMDWYRKAKAPLVLGHEIAGEICEIGDDVSYRIGDRVFVSHHVPCNKCRYCLNDQHTLCDTLRSTNFDPGGFAEFVRIPSINVTNGTFLLPETMSWEEATFIEPLACVLRGLRQANFKSGWNVLVLGSGISGLLNIHVLRALGAGQIMSTDVQPYRLQAARRFGADVVFYAEEDIPVRYREINDGNLADLVITCAGTPSVIDQAFRCVERGGTILFFAPLEPGIKVDLPFWNLWRDQITMVSTYAGSQQDIEEAIELIQSGKLRLRDMITHRLGLAETGFGFQLVLRAQDSIKVIIEPWR